MLDGAKDTHPVIVLAGLLDTVLACVPKPVDLPTHPNINSTAFIRKMYSWYSRRVGRGVVEAQVARIEASVYFHPSCPWKWYRSFRRPESGHHNIYSVRRETLPLRQGHPFRVRPFIGGGAPDAKIVCASESATCA